MTVSPGCTARHARTSSARTGTWSASVGCKTFGNILSTPFDLGELATPGGAVPDLEVVVHSGDDDVATERGAAAVRKVPAELRGKRQAILVVDRGLVLAEKHGAAFLDLPISPTGPH